MRFFFHEEAELELDKQVDYYEQQRAGLGIEFANEVHETIALITRFPSAWTQVSSRCRRCLVNRFPFGVIYRLQNEYLDVVAIADLRRRPDYWANR